MTLVARVNQGRRLRIVDHDHVFVKGHALLVLLVVRQKEFTAFVGESVVTAVQRVVESFCQLKEIVTAGNHVPARWDFDLSQQRYEAVQHFRHAAAYGGGGYPLCGVGPAAGGEDAKINPWRA